LAAAQLVEEELTWKVEESRRRERLDKAEGKYRAEVQGGEEMEGDREGKGEEKEGRPVLYPLPHIPSGSDQSDQILTIPIKFRPFRPNSDQILSRKSLI